MGANIKTGDVVTVGLRFQMLLNGQRGGEMVRDEWTGTWTVVDTDRYGAELIRGDQSHTDVAAQCKVSGYYDVHIDYRRITRADGSSASGTGG